MSYGLFGFPQMQITFAGMTWTGGMAAGVSTITAIDSSFDGEEFLTFAQGAFLRVMEARNNHTIDDVRPLLSQIMYQNLYAEKGKTARIARIEHATIYNAQRDANFDSVTVRIGAKTTARKKNDLVEDWTFQRPAVDGKQQLPTECPSCGAPMSLDGDGACRYCRVAVAGARGGWKLVRAVPPPAAPKVSAGGFRWVAAFVIFMIAITTLLPIGLIWYFGETTADSFGLNQNNSSNTGPSLVAKSSGPSTAKATATTEKVGTPATVAVPKTRGTVTGTATLTGGVTGEVSSRLVLPGGPSGSCDGRGNGVTGVVFAISGTTDDGQQSMSLSMTLPAGASGPGDYELGTTAMSLVASFSTSGGSAGTKSQSWTTGAGTTATFRLTADGGGSLTVAGLLPSAPFPANDSLGEPLAYVLNFACE